MKKVIINSVMAISMLLITALAVGLGIESVWAWINTPVAWWFAPFGIVESFCVLALVGYVSIVWMCGQIHNK